MKGKAIRKTVRKAPSKAGKQVYPLIMMEVGFSLTALISLLLIIGISVYYGTFSSYFNNVSSQINVRSFLYLSYISLAASLAGIVLVALNAKRENKIITVISILLGVLTLGSAGGFIVGAALIIIGGILELTR